MPLEVKDKRKLLGWSVAVVVLAAVALRVTFAMVSIRNVPTNTDEANVVLTAHHITLGNWFLLIRGQPYQFPVESYLLAPVVQWLPRNALGARAIGILLGFVSVVLFSLLGLRAFGWRRGWPAVLLVLVPSSYWLMTQAGVIMPGFPVMGVLCPAMLLAFLAARRSPRRYAWLALAGLCGGIAASGHMIALPLLLAATVAACAGREWRDALRSTLFFSAGAALGLAPYWLPLIGTEGAHAPIMASHRLPNVAARLLNPTLLHAWPGTMGIQPVLYCDFKDLLGWGAWIKPVFAMGSLVFLVWAVWARGYALIRRLRRGLWPRVKLVDVALGTIVIAFILFAWSRRAESNSYRYLIAAAWCFPFVMAYAHAILRQRSRLVVAALAILLAAVNVVFSVGLIREWARPGFAVRIADLPDLHSLIAQLDAEGVLHCYGSMWLANRITYETYERIVCSPPYNERFFRWPLPYETAVDAAENVPFVLTDTFQSRFTATRFEKDLQTFGVSASCRTAGWFKIYADFTFTPAAHDRPLSGRDLRTIASHNPASANALSDGSHTSLWMSKQVQKEGMWIEIGLPEARSIHRLTLHYTAYRSGLPEARRVFAKQGNAWTTLTNHWPAYLDSMRFAGGRPRYGEIQDTLWFDPVTTDTLRIEIADPREGRQWSITEVELGEYIAAHETGLKPDTTEQPSGGEGGTR